MSRLMEYKLLRESIPHRGHPNKKLDQEVNELIELGWIPQGGATCVTESYGMHGAFRTVLAQAMVLYVDQGVCR